MLYSVLVIVCRVLTFILFKFEVHNSEKFNSSNGRYIICANHISMIDPVMLAIASRRKICFMGKKELFQNKFLAYIFVKIGAFPVDRSGVSLSAIKNSLAVLNRDEILGIFPEGTRVKEYDENNAKAGIAMIAKKADSKIIPVYIKGNYKFRGRIDIYFGQEKNYFENFTGKVNGEKYTEIGKEILRDIYDLGKDR